MDGFGVRGRGLLVSFELELVSGLRQAAKRKLVGKNFEIGP